MTQQTGGRRLADGSIDFEFYRAQARALDKRTRIEAGHRLWRLVLAGAAYFKFPQKRWIRRQASSRSSVLVA
jgi:hypothetical protein